MRALIVENQAELGGLWQRHMQRLGVDADLVLSEADALAALEAADYNVMVLDLVLEKGAALALSDYASYRHPSVKVIFVTNTGFFSDGSIFNHCANACAFVPTGTPPDDLAAMVEHYGTG
ncbi:response regulator receiver domain-containing protein [Shimia abyssi]|uniref:Response regulator receiver domain-containing protein n=2 Tax=Shimia abyssi TaxID=1662395 RepID=A0A2P8F7Z3_9RHOB|nr:response regulator [Shimia abyssi]PSL17838.1 response regulator receiver domain-containing protein [Shimia abyssi]